MNRKSASTNFHDSADIVDAQRQTVAVVGRAFGCWIRSIARSMQRQQPDVVDLVERAQRGDDVGDTLHVVTRRRALVKRLRVLCVEHRLPNVRAG